MRLTKTQVSNISVPTHKNRRRYFAVITDSKGNITVKRTVG